MNITIGDKKISWVNGSIFGTKVSTAIDKAVVLHGLTVFPLYTPDPCAVQIDDLLGEALGEGVNLQESSGGRVNTLRLQISTPIMLFGVKGTLFKGGGQDRQLVHSFLAKEGITEIPVHCVEQRRWEPTTHSEFESANQFTTSVLRFSGDQTSTWAQINSYEETTSTQNKTSSFSCSQDLLLGDSDNFETTLTKFDMKKNDKMWNSRLRAQYTQKMLAQKHDWQVGFLAFLVDSKVWNSHHQQKTNVLVEIVPDRSIWNKIHNQAMNSLAYDLATCNPDGLKKTIANEQTVQNILKYLDEKQWKTAGSVGIEERKELVNFHTYGEAIFHEGNLLHLLAKTPASNFV